MDLSTFELSAFVDFEDNYTAMTFSLGSLGIIPNITVVGFHCDKISLSNITLTLLDLGSYQDPVEITRSFWVVVLNLLVASLIWCWLKSLLITPIPAAPTAAPVRPRSRNRRRV